MHIDKLFGSKTKTDILKYLVFRRQGVSMRALEAEIPRTFPAIKKQVDSLLDSGIITIHKDKLKRSIRLHDDVCELLRTFFLFGLKKELYILLHKYKHVIDTYYLGKIFGIQVDIDIIIVYHDASQETLTQIKEQLNDLFKEYGIHLIYMTCMSTHERYKRSALADKFVLSILRQTSGEKIT